MPKHILITAHDEFLTNMYSITLKGAGYEVEVAHDGSEANAKIDAHQPDLLIVDLLMPHIDGFSVIKHAREKGYAFPIIVLSNVSQKMDQQKCRDMGANDFLCKMNLDLEGLATKVKEYLPA